MVFAKHLYGAGVGGGGGGAEFVSAAGGNYTCAGGWRAAPAARLESRRLSTGPHMSARLYAESDGLPDRLYRDPHVSAAGYLVRRLRAFLNEGLSLLDVERYSNEYVQWE